MSGSRKGKQSLKLDSNEVKLGYVLRALNLATKEVARELEVTASLISQIKNHYEDSNRLRNIHLYAICFAYNIPVEIFKNKEINTPQQIDSLLQERDLVKNDIFEKNREVLKKLEGDWYMYSYPSTKRLGDMWETRTTFYRDYRVVDEHNNHGILNIGKNQSIILKESNGSKNITSITFDNSRVFYNVFLFSRVSKSNGLNKELFNFGICSKKRLTKETAKEILGEISGVQLQISYDILERINSHIERDDRL